MTTVKAKQAPACLPARYVHDCDKCTYPGRLGKYDLYHCVQGDPKGGLPTVLARFGDEPAECVSGMYLALPGERGLVPLQVARCMAEARGLSVIVVSRQVDDDK